MHQPDDEIRWKDIPGLTWLGLTNLAYRCRLSFDESRTLRHHRWYWRLRWALFLNGLDPRHTRLSRAHNSFELSSLDLTYGETPILTAWLLGQRLALQQRDRVIDLGAGLGLPLIVCNLAFGTGGVGLEAVSARVARARSLQSSLGIESLQFVEGDFLQYPLPTGTVYWLSPTTLQEDSWNNLKGKMADLPLGTRSVCLSEALPRDLWTVLEEGQYRFSWGETRVFIQQKSS